MPAVALMAAIFLIGIPVSAFILVSNLLGLTAGWIAGLSIVVFEILIFKGVIR